MTKTQRTILFFLPVQAVVIFMFYFLTRYWFFGVALQVGLTLLLMRRLLTGGNRPVVLAKSAQPVLFIVAASLYSMMLVQVNGVSIPYFVAQTVLMALMYGLICVVVLRTHIAVWMASAIAILQLGLSINFAVLSMAYWHVPGFITLPLVFVVSTFVALWWLVEAGRAAGVAPMFASVFGLVATELVWAYSHWVLVYQVPKANIIVAQAAIVTIALAYSLGGIEYHRLDRPKRKWLPLEYGLVFMIVFAATFLTTRWMNGF